MPARATSRAWWRWASRSRSANRSATRRWPRAWSNARWCASSPRARSPTRRCCNERRDTLLLAVARGAQARLRTGLGRPRRRPLPGQRSRHRRRAGSRTRAPGTGRSAVADEDGWPAFAARRAAACAGARHGCSMPTAAAASCCSSSALHDLTGFGIEDKPLAIAAAGALLGYVEETQKQRLPHLTAIAIESGDDAIAMNAATRRHLELDSARRRRQPGTPCSACSMRPSRPMGGRLLRRWLHRPLRDRRVLGERHHAVADADRPARRRAPARSLPRAGRPRAHPHPRRAALGAPARPVHAARRPCACCRHCARMLAPLDSPRLQALAAELGEHGEHAAPAARRASCRSRRCWRATAASSPTATTPSSTNCAGCRPTPTSS